MGIRRAFLCISLLVGLALSVAVPVYGQAALQLDDRGNPIPNGLRLGATHTQITSAATSRTVTPFSTTAKMVIVVCTTACNIAQAASPATATTASQLLPANTLLYLKVTGSSDSLAFIANSSAGIIFVTELN